MPKIGNELIFDIVILIPHYNNPDGLMKSILSIKALGKLCIVIVDDGSQRNLKPKPTLSSLIPRSNIELEFIFLEHNLGIEYALNEGLMFIEENLKCRYLARIDCGDIAINDRFNLQVEYLDNHPDVYLCGSWSDVVSPNGSFLYRLKTPENHKQICNQMMMGIAFVHPTIMFRIEALKEVGYYPYGFQTAEDYAFLYSFVKKYKTYNLQTVLLLKERSEHSVSTKKRNKQVLTRLKVILHNAEPSLYFVYGVIRTVFILFIPYRVMEFLKTRLLK